MPKEKKIANPKITKTKNNQKKAKNQVSKTKTGQN